MKKLVAGALALALGFSAFAQEAHELVGSAGKISFGAWGRSTFNIGNVQNSTKVSTTTNVSDNLATHAAAGVIASALNDPATAAATAIAYPAAATAAYNAGVDAAAASITDSDVIAAMAVKYIAASGAVGANELAAARATILAGTDPYTSPLETDDTNTNWYAELAPDWSYGCRVGFWIIGRTNDEKWGFDFNLDSDARALFVQALNKTDETKSKTATDADRISYTESGKYAVAIGDQAKIWGIFDEIPLVDLKVAFGKMREQELRGSIGDFGQRESKDVKSEDDIFSEFWPTLGLFTSVKGKEGEALEGLYVAGMVDAGGLIDASNSYTVDLADLSRTTQVGVGYTIPGIAQVKAQFWGDCIGEQNTRYAKSKFADARAAGFDSNDYYGRMEFGIDWLGFAGGATGIGNVDLDKTPNANLIELGFKVPVMGDSDLRRYDPETFYNFYTCLGTMGVIQKGFIFYKAHLWGGKGETNFYKYTGMFTIPDGETPANMFMIGGDALAEVCLNPFGKQNCFLGLSFNYQIARADGGADGNIALSVGGTDVTMKASNAEMTQHSFGAEIYFKKTFAANNYFFIGVADRLTVSEFKLTADMTSSGLNSNLADLKSICGDSVTVDLSTKSTTNKVYIPVGVEMFF